MSIFNRPFTLKLSNEDNKFANSRLTFNGQEIPAMAVGMEIDGSGQECLILKIPLFRVNLEVEEEPEDERRS